MKPYLPVALFIIFTLFSCNRTDKPVKPHEQKGETPNALKPETTDISFSINRGSNLVETIYQELVDKNPELKALEAQIKQVRESKSDSTKAFDTYNNKSTAYYLSATGYLPGIKDSVLRHEMELLINKSQSAYNAGISKYTALYNTINEKNESLDDLHTILKIMTTLPVVEDFQKNEAPGTKPMEGVIKEYNKTIQKTGALAKVQGNK